MIETNPAFTVVIPLYNTERYIAEALESVCSQTFGNYEVVVVNDCSTDSGPSIVENFIRRDPRIRMVSQENRGLAGARNAGIQAARGRYIALLDADDLWLPRKLELHFAHLEASPSVGVSFSPSHFIDGKGVAMGLAQTPRLTGIDAPHILCRNPVGNGSAAVMRRAMLDDIAFEIAVCGGVRRCWFDESFRQSEDIELWSRIAATTGWMFEGISEALTLDRVNSGGLSADTSKQLASWERFRDKLESIAPELVALHGSRAEAYQLRYLARRSALGGQRAAAAGMLSKALIRHPRMLVEEPRRTAETCALAAAACVLPSRSFDAFKDRLFAALRSRSPEVPVPMPAQLGIVAGRDA